MDDLKKLMEDYKGLAHSKDHKKNVEITENFLKALNEQNEDQAAAVPIFLKTLNWLRSMALFYQTSHWLVANSNYYGDHLLFERLYGAVNGEIDGVAEKALGITDDSNAVAYKASIGIMSSVINGLPDVSDNNGFFEVAFKMEKNLIKFLDGQVKNDLHSEGTKDFFAGLQDTHEGHVYLIQQRLKEV